MGCNHLRHETGPVATRLTEFKLDSKSAGLQIAVAELTDLQDDLWHELLREIDTQSISLETRKRLDLNGLSVGTLMSRLPPSLARILNEAPTAEQRQNSRLVSSQFVQNRMGSEHWVQSATTQESLYWTMIEESFQSSGHCDSAMAGFYISSSVQGNGTINLQVSPGVKHGQLRPRIGLGEEDFAIRETQEYRGFQALDFQVPLKHGHTLVIWPSDGSGLGGQLLDGGGNRIRFLLVRLIQLAEDDLFALPETN